MFKCDVTSVYIFRTFSLPGMLIIPVEQSIYLPLILSISWQTGNLLSVTKNLILWLFYIKESYIMFGLVSAVCMGRGRQDFAV